VCIVVSGLSRFTREPSAQTSGRIPARRHVGTESELSDAGPLPAEAVAGEGAEAAAAVRPAAAKGVSGGATG